MVPPPLSCTAQVTRVSVVFETVAVKSCVPPACTVAVAGDTATAMGGGGAVTVRVTDCETLRPPPSLTVRVYVAVATGVTVTLPPLEMGPTPWSMLPAPPLYVAESVALEPATMLVGLALKPWMAGGGGMTVTVALPDFVASATLVATTWYVPATAGAAYVPAASIVPPPLSCTDQVTPVSVVFDTVAVKACVPPAGSVAVDGETCTAMGGGGATTVTAPAPDFVGSATLV